MRDFEQQNEATLAQQSGALRATPCTYSQTTHAPAPRVPSAPRRVSYLHREGMLEAPEAVAARIFEPKAMVRCVKRGGQSWLMFDARDIGRFWAADKYTWFWWSYRPESGLQLCEHSLNALEVRLEALGFIRVHRRELVNLRFVRRLKLHESGGARLVLWDGQTLECSRRATRRLRRELVSIVPKRPRILTPGLEATSAWAS